MNESHDITRFSSINKGPHLLVLGSIHGNEICGKIAIQRAIELFRRGKWKLKAGTVTFLPVANPLAHKRDIRFVDVNLNRVIKEHKNPKRYEEFLANTIVRLIKECDWLLDIHSFHTRGAPAVFRDFNDKRTKAFCQCFEVECIITGWIQMYEALGKKNVNAGDTVSFAHQHKKPGVVIECGQHSDPKNTKVALTAIENALAHLNLIEGTSKRRKPAKKQGAVRGYKIVLKQKEGELTKIWKNLDKIRAGEVIAVYKDGSCERAPRDGHIILPKPWAKTGEEWFYFGVPELSKP